MAFAFGVEVEEGRTVKTLTHGSIDGKYRVAVSGIFSNDCYISLINNSIKWGLVNPKTSSTSRSTSSKGLGNGMPDVSPVSQSSKYNGSKGKNHLTRC
jgi:hypothetical protein